MKPLIWSSVRLPRLLQSQQLPEGDDRVEVAVGLNYWGEGSTDRWFYPIYELALPQESLAGARMVEFEVKSAMDKVENDYAFANFILVHGGKGPRRQARRRRACDFACQNRLIFDNFG